MNCISRLLVIVTGLLFIAATAGAQCVQFMNYPADTAGWVHYSDRPGKAFYNNDTFVITTSSSSENNYIYNSFPTTLFGPASAFSASFDFRMDSLSSCSDGLSFFFLTSSMSSLGNPGDEGCALGFPDTVNGFTLAMQTTVCMDNIYLLKMNSNSFSFCGLSPTSGPSADDTIIGTALSSQLFVSDSRWHHCVVNYVNGYFTATFDTANITLSGYSPIYGTGHFGFVATNGGGYTRKSLKNIQICAGYGTPTASSTTFNTYINRQCNGPQVEVHTNAYSAAYSVAVWYADGTHDSTAFAPDGMGGGYVVLSHTYQAPGDYTIREILYSGGAATDSLHMDYDNVFCATLPVKLYYDANNDCLKEPTEPYISQPVLVQVDSNGIPVDTVSSTSGFYYNVQGHIGDVYSFRVLDTPGNMAVSCPSGGVLYDSLVSGIFIYPIKYFAMSCTTGATFDLGVNAVIPVTGIHDEWGDVYLTNADCAPTTGTLTLHYSPKYAGTPSQVNPTPASISGNTITWDAGALTSTSAGDMHLHYQVNYGATTLIVGDTVQSYFEITPTTGDADPGNNVQVITDTVKAGCDPNEMIVNPAGCLPSGAAVKLQYTVSFNNVGNDTAFNIYVMDTLPNNVDPKSVRIVMASNYMNSTVYQAGGYTIAKFDFPAIDLVDSATCPQCNGAVVFSVNTLPGLAEGAAITNHAGVFFDDNPVVLTNTVQNIMGNCEISRVNNVAPANAIEVFPNPAATALNISARVPITQIALSNVVGQTVFSGSYNSPQVQVDVSALPAGVYLVKVNGSEVRKWVKE